MFIGLYGKLPAKRDFIAVSASPAFLAVWEPWIQGGVSAGTMRLGADWKPAFLRAPIWRFWLGSEICGEPVLGAFMPSLDGVGRYFPLTLFARDDDGRTFPAPEAEPQDAWFDRAENLLLSTLDEDAAFERTMAGLQSLPVPETTRPDAKEARRLKDGTMLIQDAAGGFADAFAAARKADPGRAAAGMSFWWTTGGEGFPPAVLSTRAMPDPFSFIDMITGDFKVQN